MSSADEQPHPGDIIDGRFEVIRELGEGGFGAVVEVVDRKSKGNYAMKVYKCKLYVTKTYCS